MTAGRWQGDHYGLTRGLDERDPLPEPEWEPASTEAVRKQTLRDVAKAVRDAKVKGGRL